MSKILDILVILSEFLEISALGDLVKYQKFGFPSEVFPLLIKNILFSWQMSPKFVLP